MSGGDVTLSLSRDEALVLFEWITVFTERDDVALNDQAEQFVLWKLEGMLEKELVEPLRPDYGALLAAARERVRTRAAPG
jgi:hypothetical protein